MKNSRAIVVEKSQARPKAPLKYRMRTAMVAGFVSTLLTVVNHSSIWLLSWAGACLLIVSERQWQPLIKTFGSKLKAWHIVLSALIVGVVVFQMVEPALSVGYGFLDPVQQTTADAFEQAGAKNGASMSAAIFGFAIAFIAIGAIVGAGVGIFMNRVQGVPLVEAFGIAIGVAMFVGLSSMLLKGIGLNGN